MSVDLDDLKPFFEAFQAETDRACGVLAGALLDTLLERLLRLALPEAGNEVFQGAAPLASFSAKIDMAYYMRLLSEEDRRDLHLVRKIRNDFAHAVDHTLGFSAPNVANRVRELRLPKLLYESPTLHVSDETSRGRFQVGVGILSYLLTDVRPRQFVPFRRPTNFSETIRLA
ncbi:MAG TPA: hypothetical protein VGR37_01895 [Longimicrobiaceae bacterium]|nr:hypothetical protein [Longimicrobiaceae bacterium]